MAPYIAAVLSTLVFFRDTLLTGRLPGDLEDARWTVALTEHWYDVWQGDEAIRDVLFFYPVDAALGMSDAFLLQGQLHAIGRILGLDMATAWMAANGTVFLLGAMGVAALSRLILHSPAFQVAFVVATCLSYPLNVMVGHPQVMGFLCASWIFVGAVWAGRGAGGAPGVLLTILATPVLVLTSWYAAILGVLVLVTLAAFSALLTPLPVLRNVMSRYFAAIRQSLSTWYGWVSWSVAAAVWALAVWIHLPARDISPRTEWAEVMNYSPRLSDLMNAAAGGGGIWGAFYDRIFPAQTFDHEQALGFTPVLFGSLVIAVAMTLRRLTANRFVDPMDGPLPWVQRTTAIRLAAALTVVVLAALMVADDRGLSGYRLLWEHVPGFDAVRSAFRVQLLLYPMAIFVVLSALEGWVMTSWRQHAVSRSRQATATRIGSVVVSVLLGSLVVAEMQRPIYLGWTGAQLLPESLRGQVAAVADTCDTFVLDSDAFADVPAYRRSVDAVMLAVLSEVPTPDGYSRAAPIGHPGFGGTAAALDAWLRAQDDSTRACVVSAAGVEPL